MCSSLCSSCCGIHICWNIIFSDTFVVSHAHYLFTILAPPLSVCTLDGVALKGASDNFHCPKISDGKCHTPFAYSGQSVNGTCSPDNYVLLEAFRNTHFVYENDTLEWKSIQPECSIGIPGLAKTSTVVENTGSHYLRVGEVHPGEKGEGLQLSAQVTSSFFILISIFFPSVTGQCSVMMSSC